MKNLIPLGLLVLFLVAAQFSSAQTVDDVIAKYITARGGKDKLVAVKSIYMEGIRQMMGTDHVVKVTKEQNKLSRIDFEMGTQTGFTVVTPTEAWFYIPFRSPNPFPLPADAVAGMQTDLDIAGPLVDYAAKGHTVELLGKDTTNGDSCYKIKLTAKNGKIIYYWISTKTNLLVASAQTSSGMFGSSSKKDPNALIITFYKDYSSVNGIQFPHTITIKTTSGENGGGGSTTFDVIQLNSPVDSSMFKHTPVVTPAQ
ncbi:MAG TPA: hypothetical protein VK718_01430 [Ferruginibacter sp.]|jgi:hypothetical protein|nr:hypothetical protein [Ferruginibacter sp.]